MTMPFQIRIERRLDRKWWYSVLTPVLSVFAALLGGAIFLATLSQFISPDFLEQGAMFSPTDVEEEPEADPAFLDGGDCYLPTADLFDEQLAGVADKWTIGSPEGGATWRIPDDKNHRWVLPGTGGATWQIP